nr:hypothetical protein [Bacillus sp. Marseille-P3661]
MLLNRNSPDFDQLNDRVIADSTSAPTFVIKTNLDPKNIKEENPYYNEHASPTEKEKLKEFFD